MTGCSTPWNYGSTSPVVATPDAVSVRLADAADKVGNALQSLASVEQTRTPAPLPPTMPAPDDGLKTPITVSWEGPIAPLLLRLANRAGYQYQQVGPVPGTPITVSINVVGKPILEILRDAGLQAGTKANLLVDSNRRLVELEYGPIPR